MFQYSRIMLKIFVEYKQNDVVHFTITKTVNFLGFATVGKKFPYSTLGEDKNNRVYELIKSGQPKCIFVFNVEKKTISTRGFFSQHNVRTYNNLDEFIKTAMRDNNFDRAQRDYENQTPYDDEDEEDEQEREQERKIQQYQDNLDDRYDKQQNNKRDEHWNFP